MTGPFDAVVIGAGLGGLSAAASLARLGRRVLVVERQDGPGGAAHAFVRDGYTFDPAVHVTGQAAPGQLLDIYLHLLGVRDRVDFVVLPHAFGVSFPDLDATMGAGFDGIAGSVDALFGGTRGPARAFLDLCRTVTEESQALPPQLGLRELDEAAAQYPTLFRWRFALLQEALDEHFDDPRAAAVVSALWPYMGLPPSQLSLVDFASAVNGVLEPGPAYVRGSFQVLADALEAALKAAGGEVRYDTPAAGIEVRDGRVTGVTLAGGEHVAAPLVVSNADPYRTFLDLVGEEHVPAAFVKKLRRGQPSISAFCLYSATSRPVAADEVAHEVFTYDHWDHDATWADVAAGRPGGTWVSVPTLVDPSLAPDGEHLVIVSTLARYDLDWDAERDRYTDALVDTAERLLPGYRDAVTYTETATPRTIERFIGSREGAIYGWANTPRQTIPRRLAPRTPIDGLWLTGHWTHPGSSSVRAVYSGILVAMLIAGLSRPEELFGALAGAG